MSKEIRKVLTFRAASLGDALMGKYFLENVRAAYPEAKCFLLVSMRGEMIRDLLKAYPWITVLEVNRRKPSSIVRACRELWGTDITLTPGTPFGRFSTVSKLFARIVTKSGGLIGYSDTFPHNHLFYDMLLETDHQKAAFLREQDVLSAAHIPTSVTKPRYTAPIEKEVLKRFALTEEKYIVVHLFSGSINRGLSPERMDLTMKTIADYARGKYTLVLTGGRGDQPVLDALAQKYDAVSAAGRTTVSEMANLVTFSFMVVSVDTGAAHMASGLGKRTIVMRCYQAAYWWHKEQHTERVTVLTGERGQGDTDIRNQPYPHSLNSISMEALQNELNRS